MPASPRAIRPDARRRALPEPVPDRPGKGRGREFVYRTLKDRIVSLSLAPGAELEEGGLGAELGVSRTPLREALVKLAADGLVVLMPNRGARVAPMDLRHVQEHLEAFDLIQRVVTAWAALRRSEADLVTIRRFAASFEDARARRDSGAMLDLNFQFHESIGRACANGHLVKVYLGLLSENLRIARLAMTHDCYGTEQAYESHLATIVREHRLIVEAIGRGDAAAAETLAGSHAGLARQRVLEFLSVSLVGRAGPSLLEPAA